MIGDFAFGGLALLVAFTACDIAEQDRCGDDYVFRNGACFPRADAAARPDSRPASADRPRSDLARTDGRPEAAVVADAVSSGIGDTCKGVDDCKGKAASYCAVQPGAASGYCTFQGCGVSPDSCPAGYACCDFPASIPVANFCAKQADYLALGTMCKG